MCDSIRDKQCLLCAAAVSLQGPGAPPKKLETLTRLGQVYVEKCVLETGFVQQQSLNAMESGLQVQQWAKKLHAQLTRDWRLYKFKIKFTKSNELLVQFLKPAPATPADRARTTTTTIPPLIEPDRRTGGGVSSVDPQVKAGAGYNSLNVLFPPPNSLLTKYMVS